MNHVALYLHLVLQYFFFSVGLVFFYTQRYMGWFMAAFRPYEWNESRSSNTRRTGCSGKTYWHNQDSKGKCLMSVTVTSFLWGSAFSFRRWDSGEWSLSQHLVDYIYVKMYVYLKINFSYLTIVIHLSRRKFWA